MSNSVTPVNTFDFELHCRGVELAQILTNLTWVPDGANLTLAGKLITLAKIFLAFN